jgi:hypothetical protein
MSVFLRAVVTGFGFSLGAALFRKVSHHLGLDDKSAKNGKTDTKVDPGVVVGQRDEGGESNGGVRSDPSIVFG